MNSLNEKVENLTIEEIKSDEEETNWLFENVERLNLMFKEIISLI